jgi:hypothetical protein
MLLLEKNSNTSIKVCPSVQGENPLSVVKQALWVEAPRVTLFSKGLAPRIINKNNQGLAPWFEINNTGFSRDNNTVFLNNDILLRQRHHFKVNITRDISLLTLTTDNGISVNRENPLLDHVDTTKKNYGNRPQDHVQLEATYAQA